MLTGSAHQSLCLCKRRHRSCSLESRGRTPSPGVMSSVVPHHSASLQSKGQYSWAVSFHVYGEGKRILYPTLTILIDASLQPSPPCVPYRNIIQSCELGSQGQVSPSVQILKERTWSWLCLQETECESPGVLFQACSPVSVVIHQVVCHRKSRKASGFSLTWNMFCISWDNYWHWCKLLLLTISWKCLLKSGCRKSLISLRMQITCATRTSSISGRDSSTTLAPKLCRCSTAACTTGKAQTASLSSPKFTQGLWIPTPLRSQGCHWASQGKHLQCIMWHADCCSCFS